MQELVCSEQCHNVVRLCGEKEKKGVVEKNCVAANVDDVHQDTNLSHPPALTIAGF